MIQVEIKQAASLRVCVAKKNLFSGQWDRLLEALEEQPEVADLFHARGIAQSQLTAGASVPGWRGDGDRPAAGGR